MSIIIRKNMKNGYFHAANRSMNCHRPFRRWFGTFNIHTSWPSTSISQLVPLLFTEQPPSLLVGLDSNENPQRSLFWRPISSLTTWQYLSLHDILLHVRIFVYCLCLLECPQGELCFVYCEIHSTRKGAGHMALRKDAWMYAEGCRKLEAT